MDRNYVLITFVGPVLLFALGMATLIVPNYRAASGFARESAALQIKIDSMATLTGHVEKLSDDHAALRRHMNDAMKLIPDGPEEATIMSRLFMEIDGYSIIDRGFSTGSTISAIEGEETSEKCIPLTVDMKAHFDAIFALIRLAESMERLVRISSVRIGLPRDRDPSRDHGILEATILLEAVYDDGELVGVSSS